MKVAGREKKRGKKKIKKTGEGKQGKRSGNTLNISNHVGSSADKQS